MHACLLNISARTGEPCFDMRSAWRVCALMHMDHCLGWQPTLLLVYSDPPDAGGVCCTDDQLPLAYCCLAQGAPVLQHLLPGCMLERRRHALLVSRIHDGHQRQSRQEDVRPVGGLIEACPCITSDQRWTRALLVCRLVKARICTLSDSEPLQTTTCQAPSEL